MKPRKVATRFAAAYAILTAVMLVTGFLLSRLRSLDRWDESANSAIANNRTAWATALARNLSAGGNTTPIILVAVIAFCALWFAGHPPWALALVFAMLLEITVFSSTNYFINRPRPLVVHIGSTPTTGSYPSGHTAATTVVGVTLLYAIIRLRGTRWLRAGAFVLTIAAVVFVAASRVYLGMHHPTDVVAGALLGVACVAAGSIATSPNPTKRQSPLGHPDVVQVSPNPRHL